MFIYKHPPFHCDLVLPEVFPPPPLVTAPPTHSPAFAMAPSAPPQSLHAPTASPPQLLHAQPPTSARAEVSHPGLGNDSFPHRHSHPKTSILPIVGTHKGNPAACCDSTFLQNFQWILEQLWCSGEQCEISPSADEIGGGGGTWRQLGRSCFLETSKTCALLSLCFLALPKETEHLTKYTYLGCFSPAQ